MASNNTLKVVFSAMTFGKPNTLGARVHDPETASAILDVFQRHGHQEIDTARAYGGGSSEEMLATVAWRERGIVMDTKLYRSAGGPLAKAKNSYTHSPEDVRRGLFDSLEALQTDKIDMFYLHGPDRNTPFEETLREVNTLYQEGYFNRFAISNYMSWEVASICEICKRNKWIMPSAYQSIYHALQRSVEDELFSCLRKYGISMYVYQPLAGGFLTGRYKRDQTEFEPGSRFDPKLWQGNLHRGRYWNSAYFDALEKIEDAAHKQGLTIGEVALRWLKHHSKLKAELGDAIIVGASNVNHLEVNLKDLEKEVLPEDVVTAVEEAWPLVRGAAPKYHH